MQVEEWKELQVFWLVGANWSEFIGKKLLQVASILVRTAAN
jgi:hypothetical protein